MRRLLTFVCMSLIVASPLFAAGSGEDGEITLGVTIEDFNDVFMRFLLDELMDEAESRGVTVSAANGDRDPNQQLQQVENFITQGVDAIIIHVIDQTLAPEMSRQAREAGIPMVYVNRRPDDTALEGDLIVAVASPEPVAGALQAAFVAGELGGRGNVAILMGSMGSAPQIGRTQGAKDAFAQYPDISVIREQTADFQRAEAVAVVENWLNSGDRIDAIIANNDEMAIGAVLVLEEAGLKDQVIVTGVDATPDALQFIASGRLDMTVFQNAGAQGRGAVDTALRLVNGEAVDNFVEIPFEPVTGDNYGDYR